MDKMNETLPSSSREMRNRAEKQRRDKLNAYIAELYTLVPSAASAPRKLDKTSTLRLSANFLRLHQNVDLRMKPYNRWNAMAGHSILEKLDSFLLVVSCSSGKIIYVTDRVEKLLGHAQVDMMGYQLSCFVHQADQDAIENRLSAFATQAANPDAKLDGQVYSFECRMAGRQLSRGEPTVYERVSVSGTFRGPRRRRDCADKYLKSNGSTTVAAANQHNDLTEPLFIGLVRILQTPNTLPPLTMMQAVQDEYITQHTTTGTIIQTDHRIAVIAGYLKGEVTGMSAYDYVYSEDLEYTLKAQSLMLTRSEGMVTYRLKTSTGRLIYLRSRGYIQYDDNTKEILSFFCINTLLDEEQGMKEMQEMRAMLDKLNIGTPAVASSIEPAPPSAAILQESPTRCVQATGGMGKPPPSAPTNGCHNVVGSRLTTRPANSLCISPGSYSPSESSSSSFSEDRCHSTTPLSTVSSPMEIPSLVAVPYPFAPIPFPWRPSNVDANNKKNAEVAETGLLAVSLDNRWDSQNIVIQQHNGPTTTTTSVASINVTHSRQSSSSDNSNVEPIVIQPTTLNPPSVSPAAPPPDDATLLIHERNGFSLDTSSLANNYLNGYIIWPQKMSPKNQNESLILSYLESDGKLEFNKQSTDTSNEHYYHHVPGELKVNTGTNSA